MTATHPSLPFCNGTDYQRIGCHALNGDRCMGTFQCGDAPADGDVMQAHNELKAITAENAALRAEVERLKKVEAAVTSVIDGALASILSHCGYTEEQIITKGLYWLLCSHCRPVWDMVCDLREAMEPEKEVRHE